LLISGCDQATLHRLTYDPPPAVSTLPISVQLDFDEPLRLATLQQTVCSDTPWEGQIGKSIMEALEREARTRYAQVEVAPTTSTGVSPDIVAELHLVSKSFESKSRVSSAEDTFLARLTVRIAATFKDSTGRLLAKGPLVYDADISIFTPSLGTGGGARCITSRLDEAMAKAGDTLAEQMATVVAGIVKKAGDTARATGQAPAAQGISTLALKGTIEDGNGNQLLEPGEKVTLRIEAVNRGQAPVGSASIVLSGSPSLIEAFSAALSGSPLLMGTVPPGETRATVVAGKMPASIQDERLELTLSGTTGEGLSVTPVMLVATAPPSLKGGNRFAVIVGLSRYRTPWRGYVGLHGAEFKKLMGLFKDSLGVLDDHILLLQDELAGQAELEEALVRWLPQRVSPDAIVFFYFAGQSVSDAGTGEVFLLPHDGTPSSSSDRWLSLRVLQQRLRNLGAKLSVMVLDAPVMQVGGGGAKHGGSVKRPRPADWAGSLGSAPSKDGSVPVIQVVPNHSRPGRLSQALDGLAGSADVNHDGTVTLSEWLRAVRSTARTYPTLPPPPAILAIPLSTQRK
jgi:hypothetical protein